MRNTTTRIKTALAIPDADILVVDTNVVFVRREAWRQKIIDWATAQNQHAYLKWLARDYRGTVIFHNTGGSLRTVAVRGGGLVSGKALLVNSHSKVRAEGVEVGYIDASSAQSGSRGGVESGVMIYPTAVRPSGQHVMIGQGSFVVNIRESFGFPVGPIGAIRLPTPIGFNTIYGDAAPSGEYEHSLGTQVVVSDSERLLPPEVDWMLLEGPSLFSYYEAVLVNQTQLLLSVTMLSNIDILRATEGVEPFLNAASVESIERMRSSLRKDVSGGVAYIHADDPVSVNPYRFIPDAQNLADDLYAYTGDEQPEITAANARWRGNFDFVTGYASESRVHSVETVRRLTGYSDDVTSVTVAFTASGDVTLQPALAQPLDSDQMVTLLRLMYNLGWFTSFGGLTLQSPTSKFMSTERLVADVIAEVTGQSEFEVDVGAEGVVITHQDLGAAVMSAMYAPLTESARQSLRPLLFPGMLAIATGRD